MLSGNVRRGLHAACVTRLHVYMGYACVPPPLVGPHADHQPGFG
jgi:hypothetical protein